MTTTLAPLTVPVALRLGDLLTWVAQGARVHYTTDDVAVEYPGHRLEQGATILTGTLRHVVRSAENYTFLAAGEDVRDGYVRITLASGLDTALPVMQIIDLMEQGAFAPVDR